MVGLDVILRVHDPARLGDLGRALFSVAMQDYRPLTIRVVCQAFDAVALAAVRDLAAPILAIVPEVTLEVVDVDATTSKEGTAAMALYGGRGRYVAILDQDDLIYPEGHRLLVAELQAGTAAVAFGGIVLTEVSRQGLVPMTLAKRRAPPRRSLHGAVLDRSRIDPSDLPDNDGSVPVDDHDLLLRIASRSGTSTRLQDTVVGEHVVAMARG